MARGGGTAPFWPFAAFWTFVLTPYRVRAAINRCGGVPQKGVNMRSALADGAPITGEQLVTWRRAVDAHPAGRTCTEPNCDTVLSIYNNTERCSVHRTFVTIVQRSPGSVAAQAK